ncbi:hypothetical protein GCM10027036_30060 [Flavihumibacter cheonanensis]|uniref:DUF5606 family protein n=1 Tax=Flavihumibacter cheonanensis TaxID=1442385 RepID=UPI001EF87C8D|nr:DUF5606 domain-containing protein [Flavihumibacter cheonanensis]MCG7752971.1 DUF5606 domain-containing protein [Flavihumibacter cheonanensis]
MEYNRIIAVTGLPGLFELVASKTDGAIVRSLEDQSTKFVSSRKHNFSHLESIEIYTKRDNINLVEIFKSMKASGTKLPDVKDGNGLKAYFEATYPDMDFERVYASDMKKMVKWFEIIDKNNIEFKLSEAAAPEEETVVEEEAPAKAKKAVKKEVDPSEEDAATEKPKAKKKAAPKKAAEEATDSETTEEKPKKTARKKKSEE